MLTGHLAGDSERKGDYMGGHLPWEVSGLSYRLGTSVLASYTEVTSSLGWLEEH